MTDKIYCIENNEGYEAIYYKGKLIEEGHPIEEGSERVLYFIQLCDNYGVDIRNVIFGYAEDTEEFPNDFGDLHKKIQHFSNLDNLK